MDTAWFGVDLDGNVALFDTGEAGAMPEEIPGFGEHDRAFGGHDAAFDVIARAVGVPEDFWEDEEAAGWRVFRYAHDTENCVAGHYVQRFAPARPARITEVPAELHGALVQLPVRFVEGPKVQPMEHVPCQAWSALWLSADGKVARPFPGREREAAKEWAELADPGIQFEAGTSKTGAGQPQASAAEDPEAPPRAAIPKPWWKFW